MKKKLYAEIHVKEKPWGCIAKANLYQGDNAVAYIELHKTFRKPMTAVMAMLDFITSTMPDVDEVESA
jgi:hypothetical protein